MKKQLYVMKDIYGNVVSQTNMTVKKAKKANKDLKSTTHLGLPGEKKWQLAN